LTKEISLPAFAKINLSLRVLGKRDDGYHEIETIFQTVSLHDQLTFSSKDDESLELSCDDSNIPVDENNLVIRAAKALRESFNIKRGAKIYLEKKIPSPGGLGGGSSDAAIALLGLVHLWEIETEKKELENIGKSLGTDVPFFFTGGTALGTGLGTEMTPLDDVPKKELLIITPNVNVSTAEAYKVLNATRLTKKNSASILARSRWRGMVADSIQSQLHNDFESVIFLLEPEIKRVKNALIALGSSGTLMSGSGASVFGIFDNKEMRKRANEFLSHENSWKVFVCSTLSHEDYLKALEPCSKMLRVSN
jgi:4-diphosphocytidyl-2-C-methyl-D-erythritol kinase